jgi:hypothetical protein
VAWESLSPLFKGERNGTNNRLKLRILGYDKNDWEEFWGKQKLTGMSFSLN